MSATAIDGNGMIPLGREELYQLGWMTPMSKLCKEYGLPGLFKNLKEARHRWNGRIRLKIFRSVDLHAAAIFKEGQAIAQARREVEMVGNDNHGHAFFLQLAHGIHHVERQDWVEG